MLSARFPTDNLLLLLDIGQYGSPALCILKNCPDQLLDLLSGEFLGEETLTLAPPVLDNAQAGAQHQDQLLELEPRLYVLIGTLGFKQPRGLQNYLKEHFKLIILFYSFSYSSCSNKLT